MLKRVAARTRGGTSSASSARPAPKAAATPQTASASAPPLPPPAPRRDPSDADGEPVVERIRLRIPHAHVFRLPPKPTAGGWRGADWTDKVWQGALRVVERGDETAVLLVDRKEERNVFAVCPVTHAPLPDANGGGGGGEHFSGVDRCVDSSRYFVLRLRSAEGRSMLVGVAFNERNDAFDFNAALEDSRREWEAERRMAERRVMEEAEGGSGLGEGGGGGGKDYTMKEGETMRVCIPRIGSAGSGEEGGGAGGNGGKSAAARRREARRKATSGGSANGGGGFLKPSSKDTPSRLA